MDYPIDFSDEIGWDRINKCFIVLASRLPLDNLRILKQLDASPLTQDQAIWVTKKLIEKKIATEDLNYYKYVVKYL